MLGKTNSVKQPVNYKASERVARSLYDMLDDSSDSSSSHSSSQRRESSSDMLRRLSSPRQACKRKGCSHAQMQENDRPSVPLTKSSSSFLGRHLGCASSSSSSISVPGIRHAAINQQQHAHNSAENATQVLPPPSSSSLQRRVSLADCFGGGTAPTSSPPPAVPLPVAAAAPPVEALRHQRATSVRQRASFTSSSTSTTTSTQRASSLLLQRPTTINSSNNSTSSNTNTMPPSSSSSSSSSSSGRTTQIISQLQNTQILSHAAARAHRARRSAQASNTNVERRRPPPRVAHDLDEIILALERVDERLTEEQLWVIEASLWWGAMRGQHDYHDDWRMEIDNYSYEELLALEEKIGAVSIGASETTISKKLTRIKYSSKDTSNNVHDDVKCSICQEEFVEGDTVSRIPCKHLYHSKCIKQWLLLKNLCPICKLQTYTLNKQ